MNELSSERWEKIQDLLESALALPEPERDDFLAAVGAGDRELADEVRSLLHARALEDMPTQWLAGLSARETTRFAPGDEIAGRYVIEELLGSGGMGDVYRARDRELAVTVALKTLRIGGRDTRPVEDLKLEGLLARAVWHPNVCRVYDLGKHGEGEDALWFLTMEWLRGPTLAERLKAEGRWPVDRVLRIAEQMAAGLGAAHRAGVVHRDFKPENVLLVDRDGIEQAVVTDFGAARAARPDPVRTPGADGPVVGTPDYMPPEQLAGRVVGPTADIFAFGVVLYRLLTGRLPWRGNTSHDRLGHRHEAIAPPRRDDGTVDETLEQAILRCLEPEPERRFHRMEEVVAALSGQGTTEPRTDDPQARRDRNFLPVERDPFVGRSADIAALESRFAAGAPSITLLGPGGMGKTRLAVHYGWSRLSGWPGGTWFADLSESRSLDDVVAIVAAALGVPLGRGEAIELLGHSIAGRGRCLLILDNAERVLPFARSALEHWCRQAPDMRSIVTSRERLDLPGEVVVNVGPLSVESGTALFTLRARGLRPSFDPFGPEADAVRDIVTLVDGMPLAIELAAARVRLMSPRDIAERMRKRFLLLTGGMNARHETLVGTIDGSWEILTPWERAAFVQCSVFEGGFTLAAAAAVLDLEDSPDVPWVIDIVRSLVDKSLLWTRVPPAGPGVAAPEPRFGMYASLQEYARLRLGDDRTTPARGRRAIEERHGRWFAAFGSDAAIAALDRHDGAALRRELALEMDNLQAACRNALARGDGPVAVAAYRAISEVLALRGPFGPAVQLGRELLSGLSLDPKDRADALSELGRAERLSGRKEDALSSWQEALDIARVERERRSEALITGSLGILHVEQGRMDEARTHFEAARALLAELGERRWEGVYTGYLGSLHTAQGRMDAGRAHFEAAIAILGEVGDRRFAGVVLGNLAILDREQGRFEEATRNNELALEIHREFGDRRSEGIVLGQLANGFYDRKLWDRARAFYEAALVISRDLGSRWLEGTLLSNLGSVHGDTGRLEEARVCYEAALRIHREVGNRRFEPIVMTQLGGLLMRMDRRDEARPMLVDAERILRDLNIRVELAKLCCVRAEMAWMAGDAGTAIACCDEARAIAAEVGSGPDSELGRSVLRVAALIGSGP